MASGTSRVQVSFGTSGSQTIIQAITAIANGLGTIANAAARMSVRTSSALSGVARTAVSAADTIGRVGLRVSGLSTAFSLVGRAFSGVGSLLTGLISSASKFAFILTGIATGVGAVFGQSLIDADVALSSLTISLEQAAGSSAGAQKELEFLRATSEKFGVEIGQLGLPYAQFANAIKAGGGSLEVARSNFLGITQAGLALGASSESISRVLFQLQQAASKGKLSMEDLGTAAESLPGFLGFLSESLGITTKQLGEMTAAGTLEALPALEKLGGFLQNKFAAAALKAADDAQSSQARMRNAFLRTKELIAGGGFTDAVKGAFAEITKAIVGFNESGNAAGFGALLGKGVDSAVASIKRLAAVLTDTSRTAVVFETLTNVFYVLKNGAVGAFAAIRGILTGLLGGTNASKAATGLSYSLLELSARFVDFGKSDVFINVGKVAGAIFRTIAASVAQLYRIVVPFVPVFEKILNVLYGYGSVTRVVQNGFEGIAKSAAAFLIKFFDAVQGNKLTDNTFINVLVSAMGALVVAGRLVGHIFESLFGKLKTQGGIADKVGGGLVYAFNQLATILNTLDQGLFGKLGTSFRDAGLGPTALGIVNAFYKVIDVVKRVYDYVVGLKPAFLEAVAYAKSFGPALDQGFDGLKGKALQLVPILKAAFDQIIGYLEQAVGGIDFGSVMDDLKLLISGAPVDGVANKALEPLFQIRDALGSTFDQLVPVLAQLTPIAISALAGMLQTAVGIFNVFNNQVRPVLDGIAQLLGFDNLASAVIHLKVFMLLLGPIKTAISVITTLWSIFSLAVTVVEAALTVIGAILGVGLGTVIAIIAAIALVVAAVYLIYTYWDDIVAYIGKAWEAIKTTAAVVAEAFGNMVVYIGKLFTDLFNGFIDYITNWPIFAKIGQFFSDTWDKVGESLRAVFTGAIEFIQGIFGGLWDYVKKNVIDPISDGLHAIGSFLGLTEDTPVSKPSTTKAYRSGGLLSGPGTGTSDSILARLGRGLVRLSNGEFVMNALSTRRFLPQLHAMNSGRIPAFATGGLLGTPGPAFPAGVPGAGGNGNGSGMTSQVSLFFDPNGPPEEVYSRKTGQELLEDLRRKGFGRTRYPPIYKR